MDKKTAEALEASIAHHEANLKADIPSDVHLGPNYCALCKIFNTSDGESCEGCPVMGATGRIGCQDTPYDEIEVLHEAWREDVEDNSLRDAFRDAAQAEVDFLKSLRDPKP